MDVAILGVGPDGRRFAGASADAGFSVSVHGEDANEVVDAIEGLGSTGTGDGIDGTTDLQAALADADVVLETRSGDVEAVRDRLAEIEESVSEETTLAFLAGHRPITAVAVALQHPDRFVGLHPLEGADDDAPVEVIRAEQTSEQTASTAVSLVSDLGWTALSVRDTPGFVAGRLRLATQVEAMRLLEEGAADAATVDRAMTEGLGQQVGPLELADRQGLEAVAEALVYLTEAVGERYEPPGILERKVADGQLGIGRGEGFYEWDGSTRTGPATRTDE